MKILIHGINYFPELTGIGKYSGKMAEWLAAHGHEVRVVTAPPYYPRWKIADGFSNWWGKEQVSEARGAWQGENADFRRSGFNPTDQRRAEARPTTPPTAQQSDVGLKPDLQGIQIVGLHPQGVGRGCTGLKPQHHTLKPDLQVYRCPVWVPARPSGVKRLLHLASFALSSLPVMLRQVFWRPDVVWVVEPALFCAPQAWLVARLCGAKCWLHIQDFEVDAAFDLGLLKGARLRRWVLGAERWLLRRFDRVSTISRRMLVRLGDKGVPGE